MKPQENPKKKECSGITTPPRPVISLDRRVITWASFPWDSRLCEGSQGSQCIERTKHTPEGPYCLYHWRKLRKCATPGCPNPAGPKRPHLCRDCLIAEDIEMLTQQREDMMTPSSCMGEVEDHGQKELFGLHRDTRRRYVQSRKR